MKAIHKKRGWFQLNENPNHSLYGVPVYVDDDDWASDFVYIHHPTDARYIRVPTDLFEARFIPCPKEN